MKRSNSVLLLIAIIFNSGCATNYLWTESHTSSYCEPAQNAALQVFEAPKEHDLLAVYSEINEHNDSVIRRAYLVRANAQRVSASHRPEFLDPNLALTLRPVPLHISTNSLPNFDPQQGIDHAESGWVATSSANQHRFALFNNREHRGTYDLPVYEDGSRFFRRAFWTPLTLTLDVTVIGGILYLQAGAPGVACH